MAVLADPPGQPRDMSFRPSLSLLGWALNEEQSLEEYVARAEVFLRSVSDDYELILIDDGSTDRTWEIAVEAQKTRPWLKPYKNERNRGSGYNTKRAISLATKDYLFWQTVDWAYDITTPRKLTEPDALARLQQAGFLARWEDATLEGATARLLVATRCAGS